MGKDEGQCGGRILIRS